MTSKPNLMSNTRYLDKYLSLDQAENQTQVSYVFREGAGSDATKEKTKTLDFVPMSVDEVPIWNYATLHKREDGSMTTKEYQLKPVVMYRDPFRKGNNKLVWCETQTFDGKPNADNTRASCVQAMDQVRDKYDPWFGIEQEYSLMDPSSRGTWPLGWPADGFAPTGCYEYLYGVGTNKVYGRDVGEAHYRACLYAGIPICGVNAEGMPCQWEFQVGPSAGVACADHLWMARHILYRVAEDLGIVVSLDPRIIPGWIGSGAHTNYSTKQSRAQETGMTAIEDMIAKLKVNHDKHIKVYDLNQGKDNERRLRGGIVSSSVNEFSSRVGERDVSVRIPQQVAHDGCGYIEDRRPASNCDPYAVIEAIVRTTLLNE